MMEESVGCSNETRSSLNTPPHRPAGLRDILGASLKRSLASRLACPNLSAASASAARAVVSGPTEGAANAHVLRVFDRPTASVQQAKTNPSPCHRVNAVSQCLYSTFYFLAVVRRIRRAPRECLTDPALWGFAAEPAMSRTPCSQHRPNTPSKTHYLLVRTARRLQCCNSVAVMSGSGAGRRG